MPPCLAASHYLSVCRRGNAGVGGEGGSGVEYWAGCAWIGKLGAILRAHLCQHLAWVIVEAAGPTHARLHPTALPPHLRHSLPSSHCTQLARPPPPPFAARSGTAPGPALPSPDTISTALQSPDTISRARLVWHTARGTPQSSRRSRVTWIQCAACCFDATRWSIARISRGRQAGLRRHDPWRVLRLSPRTWHIRSKGSSGTRSDAGRAALRCKATSWGHAASGAIERKQLDSSPVGPDRSAVCHAQASRAPPQHTGSGAQ
jgi:hypothetical protein